VRTASERRAAGDEALCECPAHVEQARRDTRWNGVNYLSGDRLDRLAALLRALVVQTLLDPATWARPEGWRP
jgi:hypothetical protein